MDSSTVGTYTVTYNVTDANGNKATEVTRTVNVVDTTVPVITLLGETPVTVEVGSTYTDAGATASDNYDGNLTGSIVTVNSVDSDTSGTYTVTYNVTDANGNKATEVTRTVNVVDTTAPTIATMDTSVFSWGNVLNATEDNSDGTITVTTSGVEDNQQLSVLLNGITYTASISSNSAVLTIEAANLQALENAKNYAVTADVSDLAGNAATQVTSASFNVDTELPVIALNGNASVTIEAPSTYTDSGAIAVDSKDGNLTSSIVTVNDVNTSVIGTYTITYDVTDAAGNAAVQKTRTVIVVDTTIPVITLTGDSSVTTEAGATYSDAGATANDTLDGDITSNISTNSDVDTSTPGSYTVTYDVSDSAGNSATQVTRTVTVSDTTSPVITLVGEASVSIDQGSTYTDAGATASDSLDGDITSSIVTVNNVDANTAGTYTITYNVTDSSGNAATQVTRTVTVASTSGVTTASTTAKGQVIYGLSSNDQYGRRVGLNKDGTVMITSEYLNDDRATNAGAVLVHAYNFTSQTWEQRGSTLYGTGSRSDFNGYGVEINDDGTIIAIGAQGDDDNGTSSGSITIYQWNGGLWNSIGVLKGSQRYDGTGRTISLSGDGTRIAFQKQRSSNSAGNTRAGEVLVYEYAGGTTWTQVGSSIYGGAANSYLDKFYLSGDGQSLLVLDARLTVNTTSDGKVSVYKYQGNEWVETGSFVGEGIEARLGGTGSYGINYDGTIVQFDAIHSGQIENTDDLYNNYGLYTTSYIYEYSGSSWALKGNKIEHGLMPDSSNSMNVISDDGLTFIKSFANGNVYVNYNDMDFDWGSLMNQGAARIYKFTGGDWVTTEIQPNAGTTTKNDGWFSGIALSSDGSTLAGGTTQDDTAGTNFGAVKVWTLD